MSDPMVLACCQTIGNWRQRRLAKGRAVTDDDVRAQVTERWDFLSAEQTERIVKLVKLPRDERQ